MRRMSIDMSPYLTIKSWSMLFIINTLLSVVWDYIHVRY